MHWNELLQCLLLHLTYFIEIHIPDAFESSKMLCEQYYLTAPELKLNQVNGKMRVFYICPPVLRQSAESKGSHFYSPVGTKQLIYLGLAPFNCLGT